MGRNAGGFVLLQINRTTSGFLQSVGRSGSPEMRAAAQVLKRAIRKTLSAGEDFQGPVQQGKGRLGHAPSRPGQPPAKQSGFLAASVRDGPIGDVRRVAVLAFYAPFMEFGVDTRRDGLVPRSRRDLFTGQRRTIRGASLLAFARKVRRRAAGTSNKLRQVTIDPRPFMDRSLAAAQDRMADVLVTSMQQRMPSTTL